MGMLPGNGWVGRENGRMAVRSGRAKLHELHQRPSDYAPPGNSIEIRPYTCLFSMRSLKRIPNGRNVRERNHPESTSADRLVASGAVKKTMSRFYLGPPAQVPAPIPRASISGRVFRFNGRRACGKCSSFRRGRARMFSCEHRPVLAIPGDRYFRKARSDAPIKERSWL